MFSSIMSLLYIGWDQLRLLRVIGSGGGIAIFKCSKMNGLMNTFRTVRIALLVILCLIIAACSSPLPETQAPTTPDPVVTDTSPTPEPAETPKTTPTSSTGLAILVAPSGSDPGQVEAVQDIVSDLAAGSGLEFQQVTSLPPGDLEEKLRLVFALSPDPGLQGLAAAAPGIQFVGIGVPGLQPGGNLSVIAGEGAGFDQLGFVAGYIAALVTSDWRVGTLSLSDSAAGTASRQGFLNGVIFFCGLCRPTYPPYLTYPMYIELPTGATTEEWQAAAGTLQGSSVETIFLAPGAADESLLTTLAQQGVNLIGSTAPPPAFEDHWIATVSLGLDPVLRQIWPDLLSGRGGVELSPSVEIGDVNPELLSQGRLRLAEELVQNLQDGLVDTGVSLASPAVP
jgi:hypothetical protein